MKTQSTKNQAGPTTKQGLVILAILMFIGLAIVVWISSMSAWQPTNSSLQDNNNATAVNSCLDSTWNKLKEQWPDGETKDIHTGHRLTMDYYNDQLDCFARYNQDGSYDTDIQRLNDRKSDELASYQSQSQAEVQRQTNRISCASSAIGSTAYTNCY